jgi:hypothetical protein
LCDNSAWRHLFEVSPFFFQYEHYIELRLHAPDAAELARWEGYALSRLRKLMQALEYTGAVTYVHPYNCNTGGGFFVNPHPQPEPQQAETAAAGRSYCYLYLGFELCPHWAQANDVASTTASGNSGNSNLSNDRKSKSAAAARVDAVGGPVHAAVMPVLKYFVATELEYQYPGSGGKNSTVGVQASCMPWAGLDFPAQTGAGPGPDHQEKHAAARKDIADLQQLQWLHEQHQYEQQQTAAMQQQQQYELYHQHQRQPGNRKNKKKKKKKKTHAGGRPNPNSRKNWP